MKNKLNHVYRIASSDMLFNMLFALTCVQMCIYLMCMFMLDVGCAPANRYVQSINNVFSLTLNSDTDTGHARQMVLPVLFCFFAYVDNQIGGVRLPV